MMTSSSTISIKIIIGADINISSTASACRSSGSTGVSIRMPIIIDMSMIGITAWPLKSRQPALEGRPHRPI